ncbi:endonuclease/exonuclease/phosphatase family protein [Olivibacter sp. XZL3]|uniref:endonuclease/exonuclease/phosphatase family protein n=1 Tax=Olivibacter sp. XZL3 TaxID=1735116 RepID=UPI00106504A7|nr:endonuclease/exonuclease/phosphatase family protein [Olivibacter sp. XZL3]
MDLILRGKLSSKWMNLFFITCLLFLAVKRYFQICRVPMQSSALISVASHVDWELPANYEGEFSVITYNIAGLPQIISSAVTERSSSIAEIGRRLNDYDIVHVQEDFNYNSYLYYGGNEHPFKTKTKGAVPFGDGLNTLSKYRITEIRRIPWNNCTGADCLTPKGFTFSKIEVGKGVYIDFYNVHANAADDPAAAAARRKNMIQLSNYIKEHSGDRAVIVMGDLNAHFCYEHDNIRDLLSQNQLKDAWIYLKGNDCFPTFREFVKEDILKLNDDCESIDKILYRSSAELLLTPKAYRLENEKFNTKDGIPLSDHCPVSLSFGWRQLQ